MSCDITCLWLISYGFGLDVEETEDPVKKNLRKTRFIHPAGGRCVAGPRVLLRIVALRRLTISQTPRYEGGVGSYQELTNDGREKSWAGGGLR